MKIFVCVKQVPDATANAAVNPDGTLNRAAMPAIVNPDDLNAIEEAIRFKENFNAEVIAVSMGPDAAKKALRQVLAMGADRAILVCGKEFGGSDTYATSQILAAAINHIGFEKDDIILCGHQAIDGDTAQVGPEIAEKLGITQVTYATEIKKEEDYFKIKRLTEDGYNLIKTKAPFLATCMKELNNPRYMSIKGIEKSYTQEITVFDYNELKNEEILEPDSIGIKGSPTKVFFSFTEPKKKQCKVYLGSVAEAAGALVSNLTEKNII